MIHLPTILETLWMTAPVGILLFMANNPDLTLRVLNRILPWLFKRGDDDGDSS